MQAINNFFCWVPVELFPGHTHHSTLHRNYFKAFDVETFMQATHICFIIMIDRAGIPVTAQSHS